MPGGFAPGKGALRSYEPGLRFEMMQAGGDFLETAIRATPAGEQRSTARIDLVYGAAQADEVFFSWQGDRLYELPVVWLHPLNRWANARLYRHGKGDFSRDATTRCLECHNTWMEHVSGTANEYRRDNLVLGVTCERCHGPGRDHVAFHLAHPDAAAAHAVIHPGRLSRERQLAVCTQCHASFPKARGPAFRYRPGEPLEAYFRPSSGKHPEDDHVANQIKYLRQSKCFQQSDLTCTTCHDPHRWHRRAPSAGGHPSCLKCHQPEACREQPRLPEAVRGDCVGCHMPPRVWMNVHFHTEDDRYVPPIRRYQHRIAIYPIARQEVLLGWYRQQTDAASRQEADRITRALVAHWLSEAEQRRRQHRFLAAIGAVREALLLESTPALHDALRQATATQAQVDSDLNEALHDIDERRFPAAIEWLEKLLRLKPDHAEAHGRLGTAYAAVGKRELAVEHLRAVARYDPDDPYGWMMLGWLDYLRGDAEAALDAYRRADEVEPFTSKTHYHRGLALLQLSRWADAEAAFRQVLVIDPNHAGAYQGLGHALRKQGSPQKALRYARRAARLTREENADVLVSLAETCAELGRHADAEDAAIKALDAAQASTPQMVPRIRQLLADVRARARQAPR
jgi:tetratricopeptide (TPR) repeat protein